MKKSQAERTTASNLEEKFNRGEDVLDYFDLSKAHVVPPRPGSKVKTKFAHTAKRNSLRGALVREREARYRKKK
jgi:hypothetical protein